jgi:ATP-binding cassette subfamily B protein
LEKAKGKVEFRNVWFAYDHDTRSRSHEDPTYVLKDISFSVAPGETVALVGHTGAGKTSIINLISRFYDVQRGTILVDDHDIKDIRLQDLRRGIAVVLQDVFLFSGTVRHNIDLGDEHITFERVQAAARVVGAHRFIDRLEGTYDADVKERGATLSVGEKQLLSFARALAFNPRILILDEATSSVDTETEQLIQTAIQKLLRNRTSIVIAHRLSTIQKADKILVLHKGVIRESGTHNELLLRDGIYKRLYELQYKQQERPAA